MTCALLLGQGGSVLPGDGSALLPGHGLALLAGRVAARLAGDGGALLPRHHPGHLLTAATWPGDVLMWTGGTREVRCYPVLVQVLGRAGGRT